MNKPRVDWREEFDENVIENEGGYLGVRAHGTLDTKPRSKECLKDFIQQTIDQLTKEAVEAERLRCYEEVGHVESMAKKAYQAGTWDDGVHQACTKARTAIATNTMQERVKSK